MLKNLLPFILLFFTISCGELSNPLDPDKNKSEPVDNTDPMVSQLEEKGLRPLSTDGEFYLVEAETSDSLGSIITYQGLVHRDCIKFHPIVRCATVSEQVQCSNTNLKGCYDSNQTTRLMMKKTFVNFCSQNKANAIDVTSTDPCNENIIQIRSVY